MKNDTLHTLLRTQLTEAVTQGAGLSDRLHYLNQNKTSDVEISHGRRKDMLGLFAIGSVSLL